MATASLNGIPKAPPTSIDELRAQKELIDARTAWKQACLQESFVDSYSDFGGSDLFYNLRYRDSDGTHYVPLSVPSDRRHGGNWPIWRNDQELALLRQQSRMLCESNSFAKATLRNLTNYTIGVGFTYSARLKDQVKSVAGVQADQRFAPYVEAVQRCVDYFLELNRWNTKVNPHQQQLGTGNREREIYRRTKRDGETFLRFFKLAGGECHVRFIEPEQIANPAGGTYANGWSYGIKHAIEPFEDVEHIVAYHVVPQDPVTGRGTMNRKIIAQGEVVEACDVVHVKNMDVDAALKRGTPEFTHDTFDAFVRAGKLQRNLSIASAVRAATAEIWQHQTGTQQQINRLAAGFADSRVTDPVTNQQRVIEKIFPGAVRRIPAGQEAVPVQADPGASGLIAVVQGDLRQGVSAFSAPEYMTGDASNANYASTNIAGAPFVRASEAEQEHFKQAFLTCIWKAVAWAVECDKLPREVLDLVEIAADAPKVLVRDELQRAQEDQIAVTTGWKSPETCAVERGLDWDAEQQRIQEHMQRMGGGDPGAGDMQQIMQQMGGQQQLESLRESAEWDESKHKRADDGKFGSGGGGAATKEQTTKGGADTPSAPRGSGFLSKIGRKGRRVLRLLAKRGKDAGAGAVHLEHAAKEKIAAQIAKLPKPMQLAIKGIYHVAFATYTAAQKAATAVAKERGLSADQVASLAGALTAADIVMGGKVLPTTLSAAGLGPLAGVASFIPVGSLSYLAYSTARDPWAVCKAAVKAVGRIINRKTGQIVESDEESSLLEERAGEHGQKVYSTLMGHLKNSHGLSPEHHTTYGGAIRGVLGRMPDVAHQILSGHKLNTSFHPNHESAHAAMSKAFPHIADKVKQVRPSAMAGYSPHDDTHHLILNGPKRHTVPEVHAHEYSHLLDHPTNDKSHPFKFSSHADWQDAAKNEPVSRYAKTDPREAFAEFGRLMYSGKYNTEAVAKKFPKSAAFFAKHGLLPRGHSMGTRTQPREVFDKHIPIDQHNHIDHIKG